jgi:hypothetical protein
LALAALPLGACATVTRGTSEQISFNSEPSQAEVRTSIGHTCTTPCSIVVDRKTDFVASFSKAGYRDEQVPVNTRVAGAGAAGFAGNILLGGVVGMVADAATGAALEHFPNPVMVSLAPSALPSAKRRRPTRVETSAGEPSSVPQS